jgi:hypothetical protein
VWRVNGNRGSGEINEKSFLKLFGFYFLACFAPLFLLLAIVAWFSVDVIARLLRKTDKTHAL